MIKHVSRFLLVSVLITGWVFSGWPQIRIAEASTTETFTSSTSWVAPTGVTSVTAEVWGAGGAGGGQNLSSDGGGGGGGGAYSKKAAIVVVPGNSYTVTVGDAGTGSAGCTASTAGGDSWFSTTGTVFAKGGSPGACSTGTPPAGGAGGAAASGVGDVGAVFSGGQGEKGRNSTTGRGGYGGSSAGTATAGWSGPQTWSTITYPTASTPSGGGHGGDGGTNGANGSAPASGNGGGGGGAGDGTNKTGGDGAVGKVILTYNKPPNAPSQDSPANSATDVSVTPTFLMTATDADTSADDLSYKVTIYSNSGCTAVVQTNDQAVSSTGWTGSDATCTANPTACYASGSQGSYLTQSALSNNTQYWWKAAAKDPDGNGSFTNSSTCNTFTTIAAGPSTAIEVVGKVADTAITTITFPEGAPGATISNPYNDVDTVSDAQVLHASASEPVVRLKNTSAGSLNITLEITSWTNGIAASEGYALSDTGTTTTSTVTDNNLSADGNSNSVATGVAIGAGAYKALYLELVLSEVAAKTGTSTLTILGET